MVSWYDGLPLYGKCYLASPKAPWLIMFHGYRSGAERDFSGGLPFGIESGFKVLCDGHWPMFPTYALLRLGGMLYGGFDFEAASAFLEQVLA